MHHLREENTQNGQPMGQERAVDLLLSGRLSPSENSSVSAPDISAAAAAPSGISSSISSTCCQQGHTCLLWTYTERHNCDLRDDPAFTALCLRKLQVGEQGYRCDACDYDVCLQCYSALPQHSGDDGGLGSSSDAPRAAAAAHPLPRVSPYAMTKAELEAELRYERVASWPGKRFYSFHFPEDFSSHFFSAIWE
jgi:hypothetical protein